MIILLQTATIVQSLQLSTVTVRCVGPINIKDFLHFFIEQDLNKPIYFIF